MGSIQHARRLPSLLLGRYKSHRSRRRCGTSGNSRRSWTTRLDGFEQMEPRLLLAADPLQLGPALGEPVAGSMTSEGPFEVAVRNEPRTRGSGATAEGEEPGADVTAGDASVELDRDQTGRDVPPQALLPEAESDPGRAPLPPLPDYAALVSTVLPPVPIPPSAPSLLVIPNYGSGASAGATWHLSVPAHTAPRGASQDPGTAPWQSPVQLATTNGSTEPLPEGKWTLPSAQEKDAPRLVTQNGLLPAAGSPAIPQAFQEYLFGLPGGLPVSGDFDGDGDSDLGVFHNGQWYVDLNGDARWDEQDLWMQFGDSRDVPITGDWNGDGQDDIGVFRRTHAGDPRDLRSASRPGDAGHGSLPRSETAASDDTSSTQDHSLPKPAAEGVRSSEFVDQVFRFGTRSDHPVVGDWNGDGIDTLGVFRDGQWLLDTDGDGRWTSADETFSFGTSGDLPVAGDFNGDGIDEVGVYRKGQWHLDTDGDRRLTSHDRVFALGGPLDTPVVGDWNGDGIDEPGLYRVASGE